MDQFVQNVKQLPRTGQSVLIRSCSPKPMDGRRPTSRLAISASDILRPISHLVEGYADGRYRTPRDLAVDWSPAVDDCRRQAHYADTLTTTTV